MVSKYNCIGYWKEFDINKFQNYLYYLILYEYNNTYDIVWAQYLPEMDRWYTQDKRVSISSKSIKYISSVDLGNLKDEIIQ